MQNRPTRADVVEVLCRTGQRLHFAHHGADKTLCGHLVEQRRVGGSWWPEKDRRYDHLGVCLRCVNMVVS